MFCNRRMSDITRANMVTALTRLSAAERESLIIRLDLATWAKQYDDPERLAWMVFANLPAPEFEGRRSKLAESVNLLDSY